MAVNWKQIMIMRLKGVSQDRVAGAARCSKRDVARASRVIREHGVTMETLIGMGDAQVRERWFPAKPREADGSYAQPDMDSYVERKGTYRKLPVKFLWYDYRRKAETTGLRTYSYQAFCRMFALRCEQLDATARLEHQPGEKVDWQRCVGLFLEGFSLLCELHGAQVPEGRVEPLVVVPPHVPVDVRA